nr:histidine phosphatase family protein [Metabacillus lacus]
MTLSNKQHAYMGWTDSPLCFPDRQKPFPAAQDLVFSSDLQRCKKTAELMFPASTPILCSEFREMNFGEWEGKTYKDLAGIDHYQKWLDDPFCLRPPAGETYQEFAGRVEQGWKAAAEIILNTGSNTAAVVTHGGVIRHLLSVLAPFKKEFWEWKIDYSCGYTLGWSREALRRGELCTLLQEALLTENPNGSGSTTG